MILERELDEKERLLKKVDPQRAPAPRCLGDPLAPPNVATPKYQIWVSVFPGGNFLTRFY